MAASRDKAPKSAPPRRRRWPWVLAGLLALPVALVLFAWQALQTGPGKDALAGLVEGLASTPEAQLEIGALEGAPPGEIVLRDVTLGDRDGIWLRLDTARLDWRPLALLAGRAEIAALELGTVALARPPAASEAPSEPAGLPEALPELPVEIVLERLQVERIELAAPLLGEAVVLGAEGRVHITSAGLDVDLRASQLDGRARVSLMAAYEPRTAELALDLDLRADAGSPLARLSDLPGSPALELALDGRGAVPGWTGAWRFAAGEEAAAAGTLGIAALDPLRLALRGEGDLAAVLPAEARGLVSPSLLIDLSLELDPGADRLALEIGELRSAALALSGNAALDLPDGALAADLELVAEDATALGLLPADISYERIAARLNAAGTLEAPRLDLRGNATGLAVGETSMRRADLALRLDPDAGAEGLMLTLTGEGLAGPPALRTALGESFSLEARGAFDGEAFDIPVIAAMAGPLALQGSAEGDLASGGAAVFSLGFDDLARLSALSGVPLEGAVGADLDIRWSAAGAIDLYLDAQGENLRTEQPALAAMLGAAPHLAADAGLAPDGAIELRELRFAGAALDVTARADVPAAGEIDGSMTARLNDLAAIAAPSASGAVRLEAGLAGTLETPNLDWAVQASEVALGGAALGAVELTGTMRGLPPQSRGTIRFVSGSPAGRIDGEAAFALSGETLEVRDFVLARGGDRLSGGWRTALDSLLSTGALQLAVAEFGAYGELAGGLTGGLDGKVELSAEAGRQRVEIDADARRLALGEGIDLGTARVDLGLDDALGTPTLEGTIALSNARLADIAVERAELGLGGDISALDLQLDIEAEAAQPLQLQAAARVALAEEVQIALRALDMRLGDQPVRLRAPATLRLAGERMELAGLDLAVGDAGSLRGEARIGGGEVALDLRGEALPVRIAGAFVPETDPRGTIDLVAELEGALPRPQGNFSVNGDGLRLAEEILPDQAALDLRAQASLGEGRLRGSLVAISLGDPPLGVEFDMAMLIVEPFGLALPPDEPLQVSSQWQGRMKPVMALLPIDAVRLEGAIELDASATGTMREPVVRGRLAIREGVYENFTTGTLLRPFEVEIRADGPRLEIVRFAGDDTEGGSISAAGSVDLGGAAPQFDLRAQADNALLMRTDQAQARLDAELSLSGSTEAARLTGTVTTGRVEISIAGDLPPDVQELEVREIGPGAADRDVPEDELAPPPGADWLALDLAVNIPQELFIRGRGLDSEWGGSFEIGGTAAAPRIRGGIRPLRGGFDFAGKRFDLAEGSIGLSGGAEIDPLLDLAAVYEGDDFLARVSISGHADDPQIDISSEPALPRDEVISRVLFGKGTGQLTALQGVQVAQTAAALSGGGGTSVLDMARDALGVDVLTLAPGASEDDLGTLEAGKYIAEDVFVGVRQGTTPGSTGAVVEWEVTPNITIESEAGGADESSVGIRWEWDY